MLRQLYRQAQSAFQRGEDENMAKICEAYILAQEAARTMEEQEAEGWNCLAFPSSFWPSTWFEGTMQACVFYNPLGKFYIYRWILNEIHAMIGHLVLVLQIRGAAVQTAVLSTSII